MKRLNPTILAMLFFFLTAGLFVVWVNFTKPRVLVLHSYDKDYVWCRDVMAGLDRVFKDTQWFTLRYHYMKTKKFNDADELRRAGIAARHAIDTFRPDVLLTIDDYAQKLAGRHYVDHPSVNIVFAGINGGIEPYGYHQAANVTGILERKQVKAVKEAITLIASGKPAAIRVLYLSDAALSGQRDVEYVSAFDWRPLVYAGGVIVPDFAAWKEEVGKLEGRVDYLLVSGYRKMHYAPDKPDFVPAAEVMAWTEKNSPIPVIGMNFFNTADGAMLSVGVSPYEQGEVAAQMTLAILRGEKKPADIPVQTSSQYVISLNDAALRKRQVTVPKIFEAFARATDNYYQ